MTGSTRESRSDALIRTRTADEKLLAYRQAPRFHSALRSAPPMESRPLPLAAGLGVRRCHHGESQAGANGWVGSTIPFRFPVRWDRPRRGCEPSVLVHYLVRCAMHYHHHQMARQLTSVRGAIILMADDRVTSVAVSSPSSSSFSSPLASPNTTLLALERSTFPVVAQRGLVVGSNASR